MRVLGFDTATAATAVALADPAADLLVEARDDPAPGARPGHARCLLNLVEEVLARSPGGWEAVERIAVGLGPGTFTGLRIGIATAHSLARAREIPLVGVSTLQALALAASEDPLAVRDRAVLALIDARRGEAFGAAWAPGADPALDPPLLAPAVLTPQALEQLAATAAAGALAVGDGALRFRAVLEPAGLRVPPEDWAPHRVSARPHCRLAAGSAPGDVFAVQPSYLRRPDAEINRAG